MKAEILIYEQNEDIALQAAPALQDKYGLIIVTADNGLGNLARRIKPTVAVVNLKNCISDSEFSDALIIARELRRISPTLIVAESFTDRQFVTIYESAPGTKKIDNIVSRSPHDNADWTVVLNHRVQALIPAHPHWEGFKAAAYDFFLS